KSTQSSGDGGSLPPRQPPRDDLRHAVAAHRDAVEDVGGLHRALLMRDHDELGAAGEAAEKLDEAADVRVVERGLDLVEQVERAGPGEEQREQERDRAERLLAAGEGERRVTRLPAGRSSTSIPGSPRSSSSVRRRRPSPPGKRVAATSAKFRWTAANVSS